MPLCRILDHVDVTSSNFVWSAVVSFMLVRNTHQVGDKLLLNMTFTVTEFQALASVVFSRYGFWV